MTQPVTRMHYGTGALARWDCPNCGPNSLHKHNVCIHCKRDRSTGQTSDPAALKRWNGTSQGR